MAKKEIKDIKVGDIIYDVNKKELSYRPLEVVKIKHGTNVAGYKYIECSLSRPGKFQVNGRIVGTAVAWEDPAFGDGFDSGYYTTEEEAIDSLRSEYMKRLKELDKQRRLLKEKMQKSEEKFKENQQK